MRFFPTKQRRWPQVGLLLLLVLYLGLTSYQLGLPGLHYDEAREAGVNAMEILTGAPPTLFRNSGLKLVGQQWPLMVQDYIGALNVYLALPLLWLTGIGVPNLRFLSILTGLATLLLVAQALQAWLLLAAARTRGDEREVEPVQRWGKLVVVALLAASPTFVFWSRQGIFVTNLTQPLFFGCLCLTLRWLRLGQQRDLLMAAALGGAALYAKLMAIWLIAPLIIMVGAYWFWQRRQQSAAPSLSPSLLLATVLLFLVPLLPLIWFNLLSGGTWAAIATNLDTSYYGVDNLAVGANLQTRLVQFRQLLTGNHLWYLGGIYGNPVAFWGGLALVLIALLRAPHLLVPPLLLLLAALFASLFTLSDLFITHYALLQPLAIGLVALAFIAIGQQQLPATRAAQPARPFWQLGGTTANLRRGLGVLLLLWLLFDLAATLRYHGALSRSGGLADHSDASYALAYHLRYNGLGAPIALDWGFDAPIRYLSEGTVTPIELFGYASPIAPDPALAEQLQPLLADPANVYLLHAPHATVFAGRRALFLATVTQQGYGAELTQRFAQRDGTPLYELWRVVPLPAASSEPTVNSD